VVHSADTSRGTEIVERVAKAMYPEAFVERNGIASMIQWRRDKAMDRARTAIEAMRVPTPAMLNVARQLGMWHGMADGHELDKLAPLIWGAMIDAALNGETKCRISPLP
jgi:hypothetical protein